MLVVLSVLGPFQEKYFCSTGSKSIFYISRFNRILTSGHLIHYHEPHNKQSTHITASDLLTQPISLSSQCSTTGVTKAVVCVILSV